MKVLIDGDSCPVIKEVESICKREHLPVYIVCDTEHFMESDYSIVQYVAKGSDAVDFEIIRVCKKGDIVVTRDYGLAAMALTLGAYAVNPNGFVYTNKKMGGLLTRRFLQKKALKNGSACKLNGNMPHHKFERSMEYLISQTQEQSVCG